MTTYMLVWNPSLWPWTSHRSDMRKTRNGRLVDLNWNCGIRKNYLDGARVFLYRVRQEQGIVASGHVAGECYEDEQWDDPKLIIWYVPIKFDVVLDLHKELSRERLEDEIPFSWRSLRSSGAEVPSESAIKLDRLWKRHVKSALES